MTITQKTTETTPRPVDATSGRDRLIGTAKTAVVGLTAGLTLGAVVAVAMGHDRSRYLHFVGFVIVVSVIVLAVMAYRKYVGHHSEPVVEEMPAPEAETTS